MEVFKEAVDYLETQHIPGKYISVCLAISVCLYACFLSV